MSAKRRKAAILPVKRRAHRARAWKRRVFSGPPPYPTTCFWCLAPLCESAATVDHFVPLSRGGRDEPQNFALACRGCNRVRDDRMPTQGEFLTFRRLPYADPSFHDLHPKAIRERLMRERSLGGQRSE